MSGLDRFELRELLVAAIRTLQTVESRLSAADARLTGFAAQDGPVHVRPHGFATDLALGQPLDARALVSGDAVGLPVADRLCGDAQ